MIGNLVAESKFALGGVVTWWYHVALTYRVDQSVYIFDPVVNISAPIEIEHWLSKIFKSKKESLRVIVCSPDTLTSMRSCYSPEALTLEEAFNEQRPYLNNEWERMISLNLDPASELGDLPFWRR